MVGVAAAFVASPIDDQATVRGGARTRLAPPCQNQAGNCKKVVAGLPRPLLLGGAQLFGLIVPADVHSSLESFQDGSTQGCRVSHLVCGSTSLWIT